TLQPFAPATPAREGRRQYILAPQQTDLPRLLVRIDARQRQPTASLLIARSARTKIHSRLNSSHDSVGTRSGCGLSGGEADDAFFIFPSRSDRRLSPSFTSS